VWYVLYFTRYQVWPFFGDVQPKFCFVWPRWCLSRTHFLSKEKNYLQPFPGSQEVLKKCNSKLYLCACASWRKKGCTDQHISIRGEGAKGWHSGESARLPLMWRGSNPGINAIRGLSLLLVLSLAPRSFSAGTPVFPSPQNQHFQILIWPGIRSTKNHYADVLPPNHYLFIYLFRGEEQGSAIVAPGDSLGRLLHCKIIFGLVHTYLDIFENGEYFLLWKKFVAYPNHFLPIHTKRVKQWKSTGSTRQHVCYDVCHHSKILFWGPFSKPCFFWYLKMPFTCGQ